MTPKEAARTENRIKMLIHVIKDVSNGSLDTSELHLPESAKDFVAFVSEKFNEIPSEFRDKAGVEFRIEEDGYYGESHVYMDMWYVRPETDEELFLRLQDEADKNDLKEGRERMLLAQLKEKYDRKES